MVALSSFSPFHGVQETVNGEIKIYEISTSGLKIEITDLDRLEKLENGEFQIAEHKSSEKLSLLDPTALIDDLYGDLNIKIKFEQVSK